MLLNRGLLIVAGVASMTAFSVFGRIRKMNRLSQEKRQIRKALATWEGEGGNLRGAVGVKAVKPIMPVSSMSH